MEEKWREANSFEQELISLQDRHREVERKLTGFNDLKRNLESDRDNFKNKFEEIQSKYMRVEDELQKKLKTQHEKISAMTAELTRLVVHNR